MDRTIKLIWDFHGLDAKQTAIHHEIHLQEYADEKELENTYFEVEKVTINHYTASMNVDEAIVFEVRDELKPHRGEVV